MNPTTRERYYTDTNFHCLVDMMVDYITACKYTPTEMREAAILACIIYATNNPSSFPIKLKYHLDELEKWLDN